MMDVYREDTHFSGTLNWIQIPISYVGTEWAHYRLEDQGSFLGAHIMMTKLVFITYIRSGQVMFTATSTTRSALKI